MKTNLLSQTLWILGLHTFFGVASLGASNHALHLDGFDDYIQAGTDSRFQFTTAFTLEAWISPEGQGGGGMIFNREGEYELALQKSGELWWAVANGGRWVVNHTGYFPPRRQWTHVAMSYDNGVVRIYANGHLVQTSTGSGALGDVHTAENEFRIGDRQRGNIYFHGAIDEVRVWNRTRSAHELLRDMNRLLVGRETGLVGYWRFDEGSGNIAANRTLGGGEASLENFPRWITSSAPVGMGRTHTLGAGDIRTSTVQLHGAWQKTVATLNSWFEWGKGGTALSFDGMQDSVVIPHRAEMNNHFMTVAAWVKVQPGSSGGIVNKYIASSLNGWQMYVRDGNLRAWFLRNNSSHIWGRDVWTDGDGLNGGPIDDGLWHHVAFQVDTTGGYLYVDGGLVANVGWTGTPGPVSSSTPLRFGHYPLTSGNSLLEGQIDEVQLWDTDLSITAIQDVMNGRNYYEEFLVGHWSLEEGTGGVVRDISGNGNAGYILGQPDWIRSARPPNFYANRSSEVPLSAYPGHALRFDGQNDRVVIDSVDLDHQSFTIEFWARRGLLNAPQSVISQTQGIEQSSDFKDQGLHIGWRPNNKFTFAFFFNDLNTPHSYTDLGWHHWACTYDVATGERKVLRDGVVVATDQSATEYQGTGPLWLGLREFNLTWPYPGDLRDFRIWGAALSPRVIQTWKDIPVTEGHPKIAALKGYWKLNETEGVTAADASGHGNDGLLKPDSDGPLWIQAQERSETIGDLEPGKSYFFRSAASTAEAKTFGKPVRFTTTPAGPGRSLLLDGWSGHAVVGHAESLVLDDAISIEAWVRLDSARCATILSRGNTSQHEFLDFVFQIGGPSDCGSQKIAFFAANTWDYSQGTVPLQEWTHVAVTYDGTDKRFYINGRLDRVTARPGTLHQSDEPLLLGMEGTSCRCNFFDGQLDEIRLWNRVLSDRDLFHGKNLRYSQPEEGLAAYYTFDHGSSDFLEDESGWGNHGVLLNGYDRVASGAPAGLPVIEQVAAQELDTGQPVLTGEINTDEQPATAWFEWGAGGERNFAALNNRVEFFLLENSVSDLDEVDWESEPFLEDTFHEINLPSTGGTFWPGVRNDNFAARFTANLYVPQDGSYGFFLSSDDGSELFVDGELIISHDGPHAMSERSGSIELKAGIHSLEVRMFENGGNAGLILAYAGPGLSRQVIPPSAYVSIPPDFPESTEPQPVSAAILSQTVRTALPSLGFGRYHYRLVVENANGTVYSEPQYFNIVSPGGSNAIAFDGYDDYLNLGDEPSLKASTALTFEAWIYPTGPGNNRSSGGIIVNREGEYEIARHTSGEIWWAVANGDRWKVIDTGFIAPLNEWTHIAWVYDNGFVQFYGNGNEITPLPNAAGSGPIGDTRTESNDFRIGGRQDGSQPFEGRIDDVRLWMQALSGEEIQSRMNAWLEGDEPGLALYLHFHEGLGSTTQDLGPNGWMGSLEKGASWIPSMLDYVIPPIVEASAASPLLAVNATLNGRVNPAESPAVAWFEYWPAGSPDETIRTPNQNVGSGPFTIPISAPISGLSPGTAYEFMVHAGNGNGVRTSEVQSFSTLLLDCGWPVTTRVTGGKASQPQHVADAEGNVILSGQFESAISFGNITLNASGGLSENLFLAKVNPAGEWAWAMNVPASGPVHAESMTVTSSGDAIVAGTFSGTADFGVQTISSQRAREGFVARISSNGEWLWVRRVSGSAPSNATSTVVDEDGNVYLSGDFEGEINVLNPPLAAPQGGGSYVAQLSSEGDWNRILSVPVSQPQLALLDGLLVLGGSFSESATIGSHAIQSAGGQDFVLAAMDPEGNWQWVRRGGGSGHDEILAMQGNVEGEMAIAGTITGAVDYHGELQNPGESGSGNLFAALLHADGELQWFTTAGASTPGDVVIDATGRVHVLASFDKPLILDGFNLVPEGQSQDLFAGQLNPADGSWSWVFQLGGNATEATGDLGVLPGGFLSVSGSYQSTVAFDRVSLTASQQEIFVARLDRLGGVEYNSWTVGKAVPIPDAAQDTDGGAYKLPEVTILESAAEDSTDWSDYFFWSIPEGKLFPLRPVPLAEIHWPLSSDLEADTIVCLGRNQWPIHPQEHILGAPAELAPQVEEFPLAFQEISYTDAGGAVVTDSENLGDGQPRRTFNSSNAGYSVVRFLVTNGQTVDPGSQPSVFEVVRTLEWNDSARFVDDQSAVVGVELRNLEHEDPEGRNGYVLLNLSRVDMIGEQAAHRRDLRLGPIIPVNQDTTESEDDLIIAWYHVNPETGIAWPDTPIRYHVEWPSDTENIVIASGLGSGPLASADYPQKQIYHQPDAELAGFNPNEEHALLIGDTLYAIRNDLNSYLGLSESYVLLKYQDPNTGEWRFKLWNVVAEDVDHNFEYPAQAGLQISPPTPLNQMGLCFESHGVSGPFYEDYHGQLYARAAGPGGSNATIVSRFFYPLREDFFYDLDEDGQPDQPAGACIPLLDRLPDGSAGTPVDILYQVEWPSEVPSMFLGETLFNAKRGLPGVRDFASAGIVYDDGNPAGEDPLQSLVRLYDPLSPRVLSLPEDFELPGDIVTRNRQGLLEFSDLPFAIKIRLTYDPLNKELHFAGYLDESAVGEPLLLVNVMSQRELDRIELLSNEPAFLEAVEGLYHLTRNPNRLDLDGNGEADRSLLIGLAGTETDPETGVQTGGPVHENLGSEAKALTAGLGRGSGYVTLVENDDPDLNGLPVSLKIFRIEKELFPGQIHVLEPDNVFDEKLTLRHSSDFAGDPGSLEFEWYYHPDDGFDPTVFPVLDETTTEWNGWIPFATEPPDGMGANDVTLGDGGEAKELTLSDNWFIVRYRGYTVDGTTPWSDWVGAPGGDRAQLAQGWVKRVLDGLNPFEARTKEFHESETATFASMIQQAGARYEGDIAFNPDAGNLNRIGLIEAYETVLRRGQRLSIDAVPPINYAPANNALLLAASRIADFYMLLGNEAFADASDPTIGFPTSSQEYGNLAASIFAFQNQLDSLLEEELNLLRGRDDSSASVTAPPVYNRLFWNFTNGEGEVAYAQVYNITDQSGPAGEKDGVIDETDARTLFPQGHGDAWGHYLTALTTYYSLLRDPEFEWVPRTESVLLAGAPVQVDYLDERKFARAASLKAKTGTEIVDLTYRLNYVDDPEGQWKGYRDDDSERAWGVSEWARRAGTGAYYDWLAANAIIPSQDPDPTHTGIQKIDRTTVREIDEIVGAYESIQSQMDKADSGLNPVGLAQGVVPFDIDPARIDDGLTHFEQIYERAVDAMHNAMTVFDHANRLSQNLRRNQDAVDEFTQNVEMQERDYKNRLIELFGYPYAGDIGDGATYPTGYDGPDLYHYMYVDTVELTGETAPTLETFNGFYQPFNFGLGRINHFFPDDVEGLQVGFDPGTLEIDYPYSTADFGFLAPESWGDRRAPGEIQLALSTLLQKEAALKKALANYEALIAKMEDHVDLLQARYDLDAERIRLENIRTGVNSTMNAVIQTAKATQIFAQKSATVTRRLGRIAVEGVPKVVGVSNDATAPLRASLLLNAEILAKPWEIAKGAAIGVEAAATVAKSVVASKTASQLKTAETKYEIQQQVKALEQVVREEAEFRLEVYNMRESVNQAAGEYLALVARGLRLIEERIAFRKNAAAETQTSRYQDLSFRIFRNDAIQKYRAQFDLAQRYVFLAAAAYDFETQLLGGNNQFLTDIIRDRSLGQMIDGQPVTGEGLADTLAVLSQNFAVLKGQLGFNNPQTETGQFSLRKELFRIGDHSDDAWREELKRHIVPNLWDLPEFRRYCRIFVSELDGPQPGIVIRFPTTITSGLNFFGWPLSGGDTSYDPTLFTTKIRSVGVWFTDYEGGGLSNTPRVYLVPAGQDVLRTPASDSLATREWRVIDQKLPPPFPINTRDIDNPAWIPLQDSFGALGDHYGDIRKFSSFRAYHDSGFSQDQTVPDNRLVGRSVWNTDWILIIRGASLLNDPEAGIERFVDSVSDIKIFFQTYSFSGN